MMQIIIFIKGYSTSGCKQKYQNSRFIRFTNNRENNEHEEMANEFCSDEPKISYSSDAIDIKQPQARIFETTKLEIVHEFYFQE